MSPRLQRCKARDTLLLWLVLPFFYPSCEELENFQQHNSLKSPPGRTTVRQAGLHTR